MNTPLSSRTHQIATPVRPRRARAVTDTGSQTNEAINIWFGLGFPLVTFGFWLGGLLLLHPWTGFAIGLALSFIIGAQLVRAGGVRPGDGR